MSYHGPDFDGATYEPPLDRQRLGTLFERVRTLMLDGAWRTLSDIQYQCGGSEASVSARLRDLRKEKFGAYNVERRRVAGGLFAYRIQQGQMTWSYTHDAAPV